MLRKIDEPVAFSNDGTVDESKRPSGAMLDANGNWVRAEPDKASWDQFQTRAKVSVAAQQAKARESKDLQDRGLECSIDKQMFVDPTKTPCCETVFCKDCITNSLLENDLQCPKCGKDVLLDDLVPDEDTQSRLQSFKTEKENGSKLRGIGSSPVGQDELKKGTDESLDISPKVKHEGQSPVLTANGIETKDTSQPLKDSQHNDEPLGSTEVPTERKVKSASPPTTTLNKKRPADAELFGNRKAPNPPGADNSKDSSDKDSEKANQDLFTELLPTSSVQGQNVPSFANLGQQMAAFNSFMGMGMGMGMGMSMPMPMPPMMGMASGMMNPQTPNFPFAVDMSTWVNMPHMGLPTNNGSYGAQFPPNMVQNYGFSQPSMQMPFNSGANGAGGMNRINGLNGLPGRNSNVNGRAPTALQSFTNQQRTSFSNGSLNNHEDSPYFRHPINPNRHQNRRNGNRPASYREI